MNKIKVFRNHSHHLSGGNHLHDHEKLCSDDLERQVNEFLETDVELIDLREFECEYTGIGGVGYYKGQAIVVYRETNK